jgi:hypothetical protein
MIFVIFIHRNALYNYYEHESLYEINELKKLIFVRWHFNLVLFNLISMVDKKSS